MLRCLEGRVLCVVSSLRQTTSSRQILPAVAIDLARLDANLHRFHQAATDQGCHVRAHLKAHRTVELALRQVAAGAAGVSVQTASAARHMAAAGIADVVLAWPWPEAWRFPLFAEAAATVPRFAVHVDRAATVTGIGAAAAARGATVRVRIDLRHTPPTQVLPVAELVADTPGVVLDGVTGYHALASPEEVRARYESGRRYAQHAVDVAERIRARGIDCPVVSVAGTLAAPSIRGVPGVTEIGRVCGDRPGYLNRDARTGARPAG